MASSSSTPAARKRAAEKIVAAAEALAPPCPWCASGTDPEPATLPWPELEHSAPARARSCPGCAQAVLASPEYAEGRRLLLASVGRGAAEGPGAAEYLERRREERGPKGRRR